MAWTIPASKRKYTWFDVGEFEGVVRALSYRADALCDSVDPRLYSIVNGMPVMDGILSILQNDVYRIASKYVDMSIDYSQSNYTRFPIYLVPERLQHYVPDICTVPEDAGVFNDGTRQAVKRFLDACLSAINLCTTIVGSTCYFGAGAWKRFLRYASIEDGVIISVESPPRYGDPDARVSYCSGELGISGKHRCHMKDGDGRSTVVVENASNFPCVVSAIMRTSGAESTVKYIWNPASSLTDQGTQRYIDSPYIDAAANDTYTYDFDYSTPEAQLFRPLQTLESIPVYYEVTNTLVPRKAGVTCTESYTASGDAVPYFVASTTQNHVASAIGAIRYSVPSGAQWIHTSDGCSLVDFGDNQPGDNHTAPDPSKLILSSGLNETDDPNSLSPPKCFTRTFLEPYERQAADWLAPITIYPYIDTQTVEQDHACQAASFAEKQIYTYTAGVYTSLPPGMRKGPPNPIAPGDEWCVEQGDRYVHKVAEETTRNGYACDAESSTQDFGCTSISDLTKVAGVVYEKIMDAHVITGSLVSNAPVFIGVDERTIYTTYDTFSGLPENSQTKITGYYDAGSGKFYADEDHETEILPAEDVLYSDLASEGDFIWKGSTFKPGVFYDIWLNKRSNDENRYFTVNGNEGRFVTWNQYEDVQEVLQYPNDKSVPLDWHPNVREWATAFLDSFQPEDGGSRAHCTLDRWYESQYVCTADVLHGDMNLHLSATAAAHGSCEFAIPSMMKSAVATAVAGIPSDDYDATPYGRIPVICADTGEDLELCIYTQAAFYGEAHAEGTVLFLYTFTFP